MENRSRNDPKPNSAQLEKFAPVDDPELLRRSGRGLLVAHQHPPRFIAQVDLNKGSLRVLEHSDDLQAWSTLRAAPGQNPQQPLFKLFSEAIDWVRSNKDKLCPPSVTAWSPLPEKVFTGRPATHEDLENGSAYFALEGGRPMNIAIPQYAYTFDSDTNEPIPCILLQAEEEPRGDKVVAFLNLRTREEQLGYFDSFILLGQDNPEVQVSELATPAYKSLSKAVKNLSGDVSTQGGVTEKRDFLKANHESISTLLCEGLKRCSPLESFTLLDGVKSLVSRHSMLGKRAVAMGMASPDIMLHSINVEQTCSLLEDDPDTCVFSLYHTPEDEFFGFFVWVEPGGVRAERFPIATGQAGKDTADQLKRLIRHRLWEVPGETERLMFPLLDLFGSSIIPRLQKIEGTQKLILIPHRLTHFLPLHMMGMHAGDSVVELDQVVTATVFASSLTSFSIMGYTSSLAAVGPENARTALVCVDLENLGGGAEFELAAYKNMFADVAKVDIVTAARNIPSDLSVYRVLVWSSHGNSDPIKWENNRLVFQREVFSAEHITKNWDLRTAFVAILAACETGIDLSVDNTLDEYFGLDMALHVAGCSTVVSTMWKVEDYVAGYTAIQLLEGAFLNQACSSHLRTIRLLFKTAKWYELVEVAYGLCKKDTTVTKERRARRLEGCERLLALPRDAFSHPSQWGVFRTFGKW